MFTQGGVGWMSGGQKCRLIDIFIALWWRQGVRQKADPLRRRKMAQESSKN